MGRNARPWDLGAFGASDVKLIKLIHQSLGLGLAARIFSVPV
jgi:hypothetical protein